MVWWKSLFQKRPLAAQLDSELRFHIEERRRPTLPQGLHPTRHGGEQSSSSAAKSRSRKSCATFIVSQ